MVNYKALIEGLLFVVGDGGLTLDNLEGIIDVNRDFILSSLNELINDYESDDRGIRIELFGESYKLVTKKEYKDFLKKMVPDEEDLLTQSNLETLAIIAYNQPITRMQVDEIRGVNSSHIIRKLMIRDLIKEVGKSDLPGKPLLYGTTDFFLDYFGINSLDQLPSIELAADLEEDDKNLFDSKYKEEF